MTGDSVTKPLTTDPIQGKIVLKMKGIVRANSNEIAVNAIVTKWYFFLITRVKAIDAKTKIDELTIMLYRG